MPWFYRTKVADLFQRPSQIVKRALKMVAQKPSQPAFFATCKIPSQKLEHEFQAHPPKTTAEILHTLLQLDAKIHQKKRLGAVFPVNISHADWLFNAFPTALYLNITRDPRAIYSSMIRKDFHAKNATTPFEKLWIRSLRLLYLVHQYKKQARANEKFGVYDNYRLIRYEDMLTNPQENIMAICDFTSLDFNDGMLNPPQIISSYRPGEKKRFGFYPSSIHQWEKHTSKMEQMILRIFLRKAAIKLGYKI